MGRLFAGLAEVGAWGCLDEFNRLDERILSACSQQILAIQHGLQQRAAEISLLGRAVRLHAAVGIFVTMNPDYAGRSNLPDNLKRLFRAVAMVRPDRAMIAQTALFAHGIASAEELAAEGRAALRALRRAALGRQAHYDFGLRALKAVLAAAGRIRRKALADAPRAAAAPAAAADGADGAADAPPTAASRGRRRARRAAAAVRDTVLPKLVAEDVPLEESLVAAVFPPRAGGGAAAAAAAAARPPRSATTSRARGAAARGVAAARRGRRVARQDAAAARDARAIRTA